MTSHFNAIIDRHNTGSVKWDFIDRYLQLDGSELLPMWVSDFDFPCPPEVQQHCISGWTTASLATANATTLTMRRRSTGLPSGTACRCGANGSRRLKG